MTCPSRASGFGIRTLGQPVVEPRWDTRDPGDVLIETAKALGGNAAAALPFENMEAAVKESFRSVARAGGRGGGCGLRGVLQEGDGGWRLVAAAAPRRPRQSRGQRAEGRRRHAA